jgi:hypothetical protein
MKYQVAGDILRAFSVEIETEVPFDTLSEDKQKERVAYELSLRRFGRDEDVRIDEVEEIK